MILGGLAILMGPLGFVFGLFVIVYGTRPSICSAPTKSLSCNCVCVRAALFSLWWLWLHPSVKLETFIATESEHGAEEEVT